MNLQDVSKSIKPKGTTYSVPKTASYIESGTGAPVILIHGLAASHYDWESLIPDLDLAQYHSYALDLLGHGDSPKPEERSYKLKWLLRHLEGWIDSLQLPTAPVLIAHSLGGYLALRYALRHPQKVRALVLVSPFYRLDQLPTLLRRTYRRPTLNALIMQHLPRWVFRVAVDLTSQALGRIGEKAQYLPEEVRFQTALDYKRTHPGVFNLPNTLRDLTPDLPGIQHRTLVIWGSKDQTLGPALFPTLVDALPNAQSYTFKAGHVIHQSHPEQFNRLVLDFLGSLESISK